MNKLTRKIIAIDCGKMNIKGRCGDNEIIYRNKYSKKHSDPEMKGDKTWNVIYKDQFYTVGDTGIKSDKSAGKSSEIHIMSALTCITRFLDVKEENDDLVIIYGESVTPYFDTKNKQAIITALEGKHQIVVDDVEYKFNISKVHVLPEGSGHILSDLPNYLGSQYVIDIGGKTINFLSLENGRPIEEDSFCEGMGILNIASKVQTELRKTSVGELPSRVIMEYIQNSAPTPDIQKVITECIFEQFEEFEDKLEERNIYIHNIIQKHGVSFTGGGAELFAQEIKQLYGNKVKIVEDSVKANVRGFYTYGVSKFGSK